MTLDEREITTACATLYRHARPGLSVPVATFQDRVRAFTSPRTVTLAPLAGLPPSVAQTARAAPGSCIASAAATYDGAEPVQALALTLDMDSHPDDSLNRLRDMLGPPTLTVASGTTWRCPHSGAEQDRLLAHWRLSEPALPEQHAALEEAALLVAASVGYGLGCTAPIGAFARWPGTTNHRGPRLARIREANPDAEISLPTLAEIVAALPLPMPGGRYAGTLRAMARNGMQAQWAGLPWMIGKPHLQSLFRRIWSLGP